MPSAEYQDAMCKLMGNIVKDEMEGHDMYSVMFNRFGKVPPRLQAISEQQHEHYLFFKGMYDMFCNPEYNHIRKEITDKYNK